MSKPAYGAPLNASNALYTNLALCCPFNEGSGAPTDVVSSTAFTMYGTTTWGTDATQGLYLASNGTTGVGAAVFSGINSYTTLSVALLFSDVASDNTYSRLLEKAGEWSIVVDQGSTTNKAYWRNTTAGGVNTSTVVCDDTFHVVHGTYDGTTLKVYSDGANAASISQTLTPSSSELNLFFYGTNPTFPTYVSHSKIAGLWIWINRVLSSSEVSSHYADMWQMFGTLPYTYSAAGLAISGSYGGTGATLFAPLGGLAISGAYGGSTAGPSPGAAGLAINGSYGGVTFPISSLASGLAINGSYGGAVFPGIISTAAGLAISGYPGGATAGPAPGVAGLAISGAPGGAVFPGVTVLLAGLGISGTPGGATGGEDLGPFYLPYEYTLVIIETGNTNPFGIDPERTTNISGTPGGATGGEDLGPFYLPYEYTLVIIETGNTNPFGIDPERTTNITVGLTSSD